MEEVWCNRAVVGGQSVEWVKVVDGCSEERSSRGREREHRWEGP